MVPDFLINLQMLRNALGEGFALSLAPFFLSIGQMLHATRTWLSTRTIYLWTLVRSWRYGRNPAARADYLFEQASQPYSVGDYTVAIPILRKSAALFEKAGLPSRAGATYLDIARADKKLERPQDAIAAYNRSITFAKAADEPLGEATVAFELGMLYRDLNLPQEALTHFEQALDAARAAGNLPLAGRACYAVGSINLVMRDREKAASYLDQFITISMIVDERDGAVIGYLDVANAYANIQDFSTAQQWLLKAGPLLSPEVDPNVRLLTYLGTGYSFWALGEPNLALEYFEHALMVSQALNAEPLTANLHYCMGMALMELDNVAVAAGSFQQAGDIYLRTNRHGRAAAALNNLGITLCVTNGIGWGLHTFHEIFRSCGGALPDELRMQIVENILIAASHLADPATKAEQSAWALNVWQKAGYTLDEVDEKLELIPISWRMACS